MGLVETPKIFLQAWGLWPIETIQSVYNKKLYMIFRILTFVLYTIFNISQAVECIRLVIQEEATERISKSLSVVITLVLMLWKGVIYLRNKIPQMCLTVIEAETALKEINDYEIHVIYEGTVKSNRHMNIWIIGSSVFTSVAFICVSFVELINIGPDFWTFDNVSFMHELYLPFEKKDYYRFIICVNIVMSVESIILNAAIQTTFFGLIAYALVRVKILKIRLRRLYVIQNNILKGFLEEHQDLIRFVKELNEATKYVLLMSFLLNSIKIASVLSHIMTIRDLNVLAFPLFYAFMLISEVILLGWMCNELKEESIGISDAAYWSLWYNENKNVRMMLRIMMMRSQKPLTMTIGPFSPMTTDTIKRSLKAAYSYTTIMMDQ